MTQFFLTEHELIKLEKILQLMPHYSYGFDLNIRGALSFAIQFSYDKLCDDYYYD